MGCLHDAADARGEHGGAQPRAVVMGAAAGQRRRHGRAAGGRNHRGLDRQPRQVGAHRPCPRSAQAPASASPRRRQAQSGAAEATSSGAASSAFSISAVKLPFDRRAAERGGGDDLLMRRRRRRKRPALPPEAGQRGQPQLALAGFGGIIGIAGIRLATWCGRATAWQRQACPHLGPPPRPCCRGRTGGRAASDASAPRLPFPRRRRL